MKGNGSMPPGGTQTAGPPTMMPFDPRMQQETAGVAGAETEALIRALAAMQTGVPVSQEDQKRISDEQNKAARAALARASVLKEADDEWAPTVEIG